ncbi:hypothetical protein BDB01DRAFT_833071 [Pilobolus umbonatus]|nr:hypothetical protein BDB01DRAFT_833071 [Pilobolus umbonatus]
MPDTIINSRRKGSTHSVSSVNSGTSVTSSTSGTSVKKDAESSTTRHTATNGIKPPVSTNGTVRSNTPTKTSTPKVVNQKPIGTRSITPVPKRSSLTPNNHTNNSSTTNIVTPSVRTTQTPLRRITKTPTTAIAPKRVVTSPSPTLPTTTSPTRRASATSSTTSRSSTSGSSNTSRMSPSLSSNTRLIQPLSRRSSVVNVNTQKSSELMDELKEVKENNEKYQRLIKDKEAELERLKEELEENKIQVELLLADMDDYKHKYNVRQKNEIEELKTRLEQVQQNEHELNESFEKEKTELILHYEALEKKNRDIVEKLRGKMEAEKELLGGTLADKELEINKLKREIDEMRHDIQDMHRQHQTRLTTVSNQLNQQYCDQIEQLKIECSVLLRKSGKTDVLNEHIQQLEAQIEEQLTVEQKLQETIQLMKKESMEAHSHLSTIETKHRNEIEKMNEYRLTLEQSSNESKTWYENKCRDYTVKIGSLEEECDRMRNELITSDKEKIYLKKEIESYKQENKSIREMNELNISHLDVIKSLRQEHSDELSNVRSQLKKEDALRYNQMQTEMNGQITSLKDKYDTLNKAHVAMKKCHEEDVLLLKQKHQQEIEQLNKHHKEQLQMQLDNLGKEHQSTLRMALQKMRDEIRKEVETEQKAHYDLALLNMKAQYEREQSVSIQIDDPSSGEVEINKISSLKHFNDTQSILMKYKKDASSDGCINHWQEQVNDKDALIKSMIANHHNEMLFIHRQYQIALDRKDDLLDDRYYMNKTNIDQGTLHSLVRRRLDQIRVEKAD